jgi:DNA polymerase III alpha subunit
MKFDDYGVAFLTTDDVCELLYKNPSATLDHLIVENPELYNDAIKHFYLELFPLKKYHETNDLSIEEFDAQNIANWHMPDEYKKLDIVSYIVTLCNTDLELDRVAQELLLYEQRNLFDLLRFLKYMVDLFKKHNVVYGIGRGSSTASYVLYLIGVHKINSITYDLDIKEFLK